MKPNNAANLIIKSRVFSDGRILIINKIISKIFPIINNIPFRLIDIYLIMLEENKKFN